MDIKQALEVKRKEYDKAKATCDLLLEECKKLEAAIAIVESIEIKPVHVLSTTSANGHDTDLRRLTQLPNLLERLKCLAEMNEGIINVTKSVEILIECGASNAKKKNLRPNVYNLLKDDPDWVRVEPGTFKYLKHPGQHHLLPST